MEDKTKTLSDYVAILQRRQWPMIICAAVVLAITVVVALMIAPVYRSTATILIEEQEIPEELVRSTVTSYADQRIQVITQRVMTRANLQRIVEQFNLYAEQRKQMPMGVVVQKLRGNIELDTVNAEVKDPRSGRATEATIAFTVSFQGSDPEVVQRVTNELASLYLNENIKTRREQATQTSNFFNEEAVKLQGQIADLETQIADFKQRNAGSLPEASQVTLQMLERTDRELLELDRQVSALQERRVFLEAELAKAQANEVMNGVAAGATLSPADRLRVLESEYLSAQAAYRADHPDIQRLRREIDALRAQVGGTESRIVLENRLTEINNTLKQLRGKYSAQHPDVVRLERESAKIKQSLFGSLPADDAASSALNTSDSAVIVTLKAQLESVRIDLRTTLQQRGALRERLGDYEQRMSAAPEVERQYRALVREYEATLAKYQDIRAKQTQAQVGQQLEQDRKAERFALLEPPQLPMEPVKRNRAVILLLGFALAIGSAVACAAILETFDRTVHGAAAVARILKESPLAVIPYIENHADREPPWWVKRVNWLKSLRWRKLGADAA